jgi:uncharacterized OsmC-like protein
MTITAPAVHPSDTVSALRDLLDATAEAIATHPEAAVIHPAVTTSLVPSTATEVVVRAGRHGFTIDEPPVLGGTDLGANPVEHLLASLGSCQVITYQVWAAKLGITVDRIEVDVAGDLDVHGFFGLDPEVRPGFQSIEVNVRLSGPEPVARYVELTTAVEEHCPVLDVLVNAVPVRSSYSYNED